MLMSLVLFTSKVGSVYIALSQNLKFKGGIFPMEVEEI
jgi:hypothetical protein